MENKLKELEARKAELEQAFESKKKQLQQLEADILLMQQLMTAKREHGKLMEELNGIVEEHKTLTGEIELEYAKDNPVEGKNQE